MTQNIAQNATLDEIHEMLLPNPAYRREYEALDLEFKVADAMIKARRKAGLTQAELAERMGTSRTAVVRLEGGRKLPTLETIRRVAKATGQRIRLDVA